MIDVSAPDVKWAIEAVRHATQLTSRVQGTPAIAKTDHSPVTVADFSVQAYVAQSLARMFPNDVLVAEEHSRLLREEKNADTLEEVTRFVGGLVDGATPSDICEWVDRGAGEPTARFWVLDPLDGTRGFLRGGQYAVALALVEDGEVQMGLLGCPHLEEDSTPSFGGDGALAIAVRGQGAWTTALHEEKAFTPLKVSTVDEASKGLIFRSFETGHTNMGTLGEIIEKLGVTGEPVAMDSQAKYAALSAGVGEYIFRLLNDNQPDYKEKIWDQAPGSIVVEEAGGKITDLSGKPLDFTQGRTLASNRGVLATNGLLHDAALDVLASL